MEWQQIIGFHHAAKLESFTKAAGVTFRTQSALSQQIKALEQELDCHLFERIGKRGLRLTMAGERFLRFTESLLERHDQLIDDLNEIKGLQIGRLRISAQFATLYFLLPKIVEKYIRLYPRVELNLLDCPLYDINQLVNSGEIDFGISLESVVPKNMTIIRWKEAGNVIVTPKGHPLTGIENITLQEIAKYPLILSPKNLKYQMRRFLVNKFEELGIDYKIVMEASTIELGSKYVEMGLGISIVPSGFGLDSVKKRDVELLPVGHLFDPDYISIIMRKDKILQSYKSAFIKLMLDEDPSFKNRGT
ncbi:MAG: LysR family transcriptional regulator [Deltaproteobacteria bacterium]|nr:LysR family transcriptional regulator [Deltaproteobacteria bacterium]